MLPPSLPPFFSHTGNLLIRHPPPPSSALKKLSWRVQEFLGLRPNFEVVLLDHGLYRRLDETFRQRYVRGVVCG